VTREFGLAASTSGWLLGSGLVFSDLLTAHEPPHRSAGLQIRLDDAYFETSRVGDRRSGSWNGIMAMYADMDAGLLVNKSVAFQDDLRCKCHHPDNPAHRL